MAVKLYYRYVDSDHWWCWGFPTLSWALDHIAPLRKLDFIAEAKYEEVPNDEVSWKCLRKDGEPISSFLRRGEYFGPGPKAIQLIPEPELQEDYAEQQPGSP